MRDAVVFFLSGLSSKSVYSPLSVFWMGLIPASKQDFGAYVRFPFLITGLKVFFVSILFMKAEPNRNRRLRSAVSVLYMFRPNRGAYPVPGIVFDFGSNFHVKILIEHLKRQFLLCMVVLTRKLKRCVCYQ